MRELHARIDAGGSYILLVAEANRDAQAFYRRHGLAVERYVEGNSHHAETMDLDLDSPSQAASGVLMRFTRSS